MIRQLNQLERQANEASLAAPHERRRYHLDYSRLQADLQRVRNGIQDYLTPPRGQPRDITPLNFVYLGEDRPTAAPPSAPQQMERKP